jgi:hypothetical protein
VTFGACVRYAEVEYRSAVLRCLRKRDECMVVVLDHERGTMTPDEMLAVYREHRAAEDRHDFEAPFKDGLMHGERILYDAAMFTEQVGLDVHELRAAASRV